MKGGKVMLNVQMLKAEMVRNGYTQTTLSKALGIAPRTFTNRLKTGDFGCKEMEIMIKLLHLEDPISIFFATKVT